ncbi:hypothetical protein K438DRAFT_1761644 [Mycena galopus ATCC 62051]|nr:hypothetical protein K438DRAFT_1761644 [Mycena galopus ATCC 62051]
MTIPSRGQRYKTSKVQGKRLERWPSKSMVWMQSHPRRTLRLRRHVPQPPLWLHRKLRVCRLGVGDTSSGKGFQAVDDTAHATRRLAGCGVEGGRWRERESIVCNAEGERNRVVSDPGSGIVAKEETIMEAGARQRRTVYESGRTRNCKGIIGGWGRYTAGLIRMRNRFRRVPTPTRSRKRPASFFLHTAPTALNHAAPLPLADPYPARMTLTLLLRAETARLRASTAVSHVPTTASHEPADKSAAPSYSYNPNPRPPSRTPGSRAPAPALNWMSTPPVRRPHVSQLGNAGVAPAPSLHMLMPHRKPPPPYSAPGVRWGREPRRERVAGQGRGRDGEDGLTAVGGQCDEVAVRRIWGGEFDGRGQGAASRQTSRNPYPPHLRCTESAVAAAS